MSKTRNWNKTNIDMAQDEIERMMTEGGNTRRLYGIIRAMLWAISYCLSWIERHDKSDGSTDCAWK